MHFICSGLTFQSYYQALGIKIPDTTKGLLDYAEANVKETSTIQFFWNRETNLISESFKKNGKILELGDIAKKIINMVQPGDILVVTGHSMLIEEVDRKNNKITLLEGSGGRYDFNEHCDKYDKNGAIKRTDAINKINNYFTAGNVPIRICLIRIITDGTSYIDLNNTKKQYNGITPATMTRLKYSNIDIDKTVTISNSTGRPCVSQPALRKIFLPFIVL